MTEAQVEAKVLEDDSISVKVEMLPNCRVSYILNAKPSLVAEADQAAIKQVAKTISVPGFRKGKAPAEMIKKSHKAAIEAKRRDLLADLMFKRAQPLTEIPILQGSGSVTYDVKSESDDGAEYVFTFETEPTVPEIEIEKFSFKDVKKPKVGEKDVNETIDQIRGFYADYNEITDRPVKEDDIVHIDIEDLDTNPPSKAFNDARFEVNNKGMSEWLQDGLIGMTNGESKECVSKPNEKDSEEIKKEFQPKNVRVTIKKIEERILPEIDEELAKKVGVKSVEEMKENLKKLLKNRRDHEYTLALRDSLTEQMSEHVTFDVPTSIVEKETTHRVTSHFNDPYVKNNWAKKSKEEQEAYYKSVAAEAHNAIRLFYIARDVVRRNKLDVKMGSDKSPEVTNALDAMFSDRPRKDPSNMNDDERALEFSKRLLQTAQDYLISQVQKS